MRFAVLSDVHGNRLALEAVIVDMRSAAPDGVINLGDCLAGPYDPAGAADLQIALNAIGVAGNHERGILERSANKLDVVAREMLSPVHMSWLAALPPTARFEQIFACHGSPAGGDLDNLLEEISGGSSILASASVISQKLQGIGEATVVLCGHTHVPRAAKIGNVLVLNPGSVGLPAFRIIDPVPHVMEAGTPHARYAILTKQGPSWSFEQRAVAYDWNAAAAQADTLGFPLVGEWTRTGRA